MYTYVTEELRELVNGTFSVDAGQDRRVRALDGWSWRADHRAQEPGGVSLGVGFAPICAPMQCPWGHKAFSSYLGDDTSAGREYDASELVKAGNTTSMILIDQGAKDQFLEKQLYPDTFAEACGEGGQHFELRVQPGYDHSYYFIQTFMADHIAHHAQTAERASSRTNDDGRGHEQWTASLHRITRDAVFPEDRLPSGAGLVARGRALADRVQVGESVFCKHHAV